MERYFGKFGGMFVAQPLTVALEEVEKAFEFYRSDTKFLEELEYHFQTFV